jgi:low affinity Fe/Cu permease
VSDAFRIFARRSSMVLGSAWAFASAILIIVVWGLTGPRFIIRIPGSSLLIPERQLLLS